MRYTQSLKNRRLGKHKEFVLNILTPAAEKKSDPMKGGILFLCIRLNQTWMALLLQFFMDPVNKEGITAFWIFSRQLTVKIREKIFQALDS